MSLIPLINAHVDPTEVAAIRRAGGPIYESGSFVIGEALLVGKEPVSTVLYLRGGATLQIHEPPAVVAEKLGLPYEPQPWLNPLTHEVLTDWIPA